MTERLLVAEDERALRVALSGLLGRRGYAVTLASSLAEARAALEADTFDLVLSDLALGDGSGLELLAGLREAAAAPPLVLITAHGNEKLAVTAIKAGAADYLPKPFDNDELVIVVERALAQGRLAREHRLLVERVEREHGLGALVGEHPAMQRLFAALRKVAPTDLTVLVRGETGTGKELVAQALHQESPRGARPFVAVNCAAMARELVESELFGHERGAFTGAGARRAGRFEAAEGGTLFLDEIGDMPAETQAKVLRVLQERRFERVGGTATVSVDVRVVAATHRDLAAEVRAGRFREDLYYRLRVVELAVPPLRERATDVPALALRFLAGLGARLGRPVPALAPAALAALVRHPWPGNVRELKSAVERAAVLAPGALIEAGDLDLGGSAAPGPAAQGGVSAPDQPPGDAFDALGGQPFAEAKRRFVEDFERRTLRAALARYGGNVSRTAEALGLVRQSLQQKLRELGLRHDGE